MDWPGEQECSSILFPFSSAEIINLWTLLGVSKKLYEIACRSIDIFITVQR